MSASHFVRQAPGTRASALAADSESPRGARQLPQVPLRAARDLRNQWACGSFGEGRPHPGKAVSATMAKILPGQIPPDLPNKNLGGPPRAPLACEKDLRPPAAARHTTQSRPYHHPKLPQSSVAPPSPPECAANPDSRPPVRIPGFRKRAPSGLPGFWKDRFAALPEKVSHRAQLPHSARPSPAPRRRGPGSGECNIASRAADGAALGPRCMTAPENACESSGPAGTRGWQGSKAQNKSSHLYSAAASHKCADISRRPCSECTGTSCRRGVGC